MKIEGRISYGNAMDLLLDAVCIVDAEGRYLYVNAAFESIFGYKPEEVIGRSMIELVHPEDRARTLEVAGGIMAGNIERHFENRYIRRDGRIVHIMWSARWSEADQARIAVARDISERKRDEAMRLAVQEIFEATYKAESLGDMLQAIHAIVGGLLPARNFFLALYDAQRDELSFPHYVDERNAAPKPQRLEAGTLCAEIIRSGRPLWITPGSRMSPDLLARADVGPSTLYWLGVPLQGRNGMVGALVVRGYSPEVQYSDQDMRLLQFLSIQVAAAVERKQMFVRLEHAALYDPLTELPNRRLFQDRLQNALTLARRDGGKVALLYLDIDQFKQVNDDHGHGIGDLLLQEVAKRIAACVRESDTVGRIGGDEFLVLLHGVQSAQDAYVVAETVRTMLCRPYLLDEVELIATPSIGIALCPEHCEDGRQLMRHADEAMYSAKRQGGNRSQLSTLLLP
ncbi:MAG: diguanylate cyclase [Rhodocyclaceae bacterium]|nr:diguanylate cyclase [Rhodocyclaceae bacterium]